MTRGGAHNLDRPEPDAVWACPDCDQAGHLREREDRTVKCHRCGHVTERKRRLVIRENRRVMPKS